jgi:outer membrane protein OmpA-like peptidoglycan-associated protein
MEIGKYIFAALTAVALGGCTIHDGAQSPPTAEVIPKHNTYEVFFDPDRADISDVATRTVREAADEAKQDGVTGIKLTVHSTAAGWDEASQALSERRAAAIRAELVKDGVSAARISTVDVRRAELVPTDDGVREPQNRRTEIILY